MRTLALLLATAALGLVAAGCGSSDPSPETTRTSSASATVPDGRLGASADCPLKVNGMYAASVSCPPKGIIPVAEWKTIGSPSGVQFIVWGEPKRVPATSGHAVAYCPAGSRIPGAATNVLTYGKDGGLAMTFPTKPGGRPPRVVIDGSSGVAVDFYDLTASPVDVQAWGLCVGR